MWLSKIICSLILMQNVFNVWVLRTNWLKNLVFGRSGLNSSVFKRLLISYSCISFMKHNALRSFLHKIALFFKNLFFPDYWSIESVSRPIEIAIKILVWPILFFHASFMFRIHMHCIVFCIHLAVLQSYLSLFSHITCIHFATLGTQLDQKIVWLIFELCTF